MKKNSTPLVDEHLQSLQGMQETGTDEFFYTRLKARMDKAQQGWNFPLKPAWVIGSLVLLLAVNGFMLSQKFKAGKTQKTTSSTLQSFAEAYDQTIVSSY